MLDVDIINFIDQLRELNAISKVSMAQSPKLKEQVLVEMPELKSRHEYKRKTFKKQMPSILFGDEN